MFSSGDNGEDKQNISMTENGQDGLSLEPGSDFVLTPYVEEVTSRALVYLQAGYPVHFSGPAGVGKTTLAMHVAARLGRPVVLIHGDDEFGSSDLVGGNLGYRKSKLIDNFIHSVLKTEESMTPLWVDKRLTTACKHGCTLLYDEFTRSRPEANNVLLSILSEKILDLPKRRRFGDAYQEVHPEFRAIFTSNPMEYAGVHKTQDALMDRLITVTLNYVDRETEVEIAQAKSGLTRTDVELIVDTVRELRNRRVNGSKPTTRACIMIARVLAHQGLSNFVENDPTFQRVCQDILGEDIVNGDVKGEPGSKKLGGLIGRVFQPSRKTVRI